MNEPNPFDEIMDSYKVTLDCLKITERTIESNDQHADILKKTKFRGLTSLQAKEQINESRENAKDYVIFQLWIVFEKHVFNFCANESRKLLTHTATSFTEKFQQKIATELEYWRVDAVLDLFKSIIDKDLIGQAKQVNQYRNWLAHKNDKKPMPPDMLPQDAHKILSTIVKQLENHANNT